MSIKEHGFPKVDRHSQVLSYLVRHGANSRKSIADNIAVTGATLTRIAADLIQKGIVYEKGTSTNGAVGRKEIYIDVVPNYCYALGLDVANRYLRVTLLNIKLELIVMKEWRYRVLTQSILDEAIAFLRSLIDEYGKEKILGLGLLGQGYIYQNQFMSLPVRNIYWQIAQKIDVEIYCMNNIRGIAVTQSFLNDDERSFFMLHYGPGICTVMIQDGCIVNGYHNKAGEIAHTILYPESKQVCSVCGKKGCLESELSFERVAKCADPMIDESYIDCELLEKACQQDDGRALDRALVRLAQIVSILIGFSDPQKVLLCGEIFTNSDYYNRFSRLLLDSNDTLEAQNIMLVENYSEKRWKSAGIVVLNEYFGPRPRRFLT